MSEAVHAEVVVIGAGPAGIAAACEAAERGRRVVVLDENPAAGGQVWRRCAGGRALPRRARLWIKRFERSGAKLIAGVTVFDLRGKAVMAAGDGVTHCVTGDRIVLATGARERFLPFPGWTLPSVIGAGAAQALAKSGARFDRMRVVVAGSGPLLLPAAAAIAERGGEVIRVVEQASMTQVAGFALRLASRPRTLLQALGLRYRTGRARYSTGTWVRAVARDRDGLRIELESAGRRTALACDLLCCSYGLVPNTEAARLIGCEIHRGAIVVGDDLRSSVEGVYVAGELLGIAGLEHALITGSIAGAAAAGDAGAAARWSTVRTQMRRYQDAMATAFALRDEIRHLSDEATVVCRCEDVRLGEIDRRWQPRQAKLYTRAGMGACQGRVCGAALESLYGWKADVVRPPLKPVPLENLEE